MQPSSTNSTDYSCISGGCADTGYCDTTFDVCICRPGWIGQTCGEFVYAHSEGTWQFFIFHLVFCSAVFATIAIWALVEIILMVKKANGNRKEINTYTFMIYLWLVLLGLFRVLYLTIFQYGLAVEVPVIAGNILSGIALPILLYIQFAIMYIWMDAYIHTKPDANKHITILRRSLFGWMILVFLIEMTRDIVKSFPEVPIVSRAGLEIFYFIFMFAIGTATGIFLLVYGSKVRKQLATFKNVSRTHKRTIKRINSLVVANAIAIALVLVTAVILLAFAVSRRLSINLVVASDITLRAVEMMYGLVILGVYRSRVLDQKSSNMTSNNSQFTNATSKAEITTDHIRTRSGTDVGKTATANTKSATVED